VLRRLVVPVALAVALSPSALMSGAAHAAEGSQAAAASAAAAVKPSKSCRARLLEPRRPIAPKTFAACTVSAMKAGRTVHVRTAYDNGTRSKGPYRFGKTTDASVTAQDGAKHVAIGKDFWMKPAGERWSKGRRNGDAAEQLAYGTGVLWRASSSAKAQKKALASSSVKWTWTGVEKKVNGVRARQYAGNPTNAGMEFSEYHVWLDNRYRPVRVTSTGTAFGVTLKMKQDYTKWGRKVSIKKPKVS